VSEHQLCCRHSGETGTDEGIEGRASAANRGAVPQAGECFAMTRADLVAEMAAASGWTKAATDRAFRALLVSIRASLKRGQPVTIVRFGTFSVTRRKARKGKNPRTGQLMNVGGGKTPRFRPSKELKQAVR
jgi:DNA-binding protein HU-beta